MCPEHQGAVRAICGIPPCGALPKGGFATGSLDKSVRIYEYDQATRSCTMKGTLNGHLGGVISLSMTSDGHLVSGGWEGQARVWDLADGQCVAVLEGHENGTCVLGLPTGEIAIGSTGRKNEYDQPVDFKIRIWALAAATSGSGGTAAKPSYVIKKTIQDHKLSVRDLALLPGVGFVSVGNDGAVKVRTMDGGVMTTFQNPPGTEGQPPFIYATHVTQSGLILTCSDDQIVRVYTADAIADEVTVPGTPWRAASLPNGDVAIVCGQSGTSRRGHVYVFSPDASRKCTEVEAARFTKDMEPPPKSVQMGDNEAGGNGEMRIAGPYEQRASMPGKGDGEYAFFKRADGVVMVCAWSAAAACWADIGEMTDGPTDGPGSMSVGAGAGASGQWDCESQPRAGETVQRDMRIRIARAPQLHIVSPSHDVLFSLLLHPSLPPQTSAA
jgi:phospholipase A-2-activating protein